MNAPAHTRIGPRVHLLTSSRLTTWQRCPRAHHYRYEAGIVSVDRQSAALTFGTAVHKGLESWWLTIQAGDPGRALEGALEAAEGSLAPPGTEADPYDLARLTALLCAYDARWQSWACGTEVLAVEKAFEYELANPVSGQIAQTWRVAGKIDALLRLSDGRVAILEHKCLAGDARIYNHLTGTYERAADLYARGVAPVVTAVDENGRQRIVQASRLVLASVRAIHRIVTANGRTLRVSGNHPVMTQRGWVAAESVKVNDWVATPKSMSSIKSDAPLSDEEIRVIGYMIGDGCIPSVSFTKNNVAVMGDLLRCVSTMGENAAAKTPPGKATVVHFSRAPGAPVRALMERAGMADDRSADKRIPFHLGMSDRQLGQLVGALWSTDGCIDSFGGNKLRIIYTSVSRGLCEDIQHALQRLGIVSSVRTTSVLYKGERRPVSTVQVVSRESRRRFIAFAIEGVIPVLRSRVPLSEACALIPTSKQGDDTRAQPKATPGIWWDRVESVAIEAEEQTYDIEVPHLHTFVVEGIVTHNTRTGDAGAGSDYRRRLTLDPQISTYFDGVRALGWDADLCIYDVLVKPALKPLQATPMEKREYTQPKSRACKECKKSEAKRAPMPHTEDGIACVDGRIVTDEGGKLSAKHREYDESPEEYRDRLVQAIGSDPDRYLVHAEIVRTESERESHQWSLWHTARQITETRRAALMTGDVRAVPQNSHACFAFGGSGCEYLSICEGTASARDESKFTKLTTVHPELECTAENTTKENT